MKVVTVVGARPQFVKAAMVSPALAHIGIDEQIVDTGQHYDADMSSIFFDELEIPAPAWSLGVGSATHGRQTADMLAAVEEVLLDAAPDAVLVYGDTNSTIAGALAAVKLHIPVAHVEAGLRSFNRRMPEEINRVVTDHVSTLLFTPTETASRNLAAEGIEGDHVVQVGDVMYDLALRSVATAGRSTTADALGLSGDDFVLVTVHRAENTDDPVRFAAIVEAIDQLATDVSVVWPVHPRTRKLLGGRAFPPSVRLIDPVGYIDMVALERACAVVLTDSGGVQKEAYFHGRPCVVVRDETEWVELIDLGWIRLVPPMSSGAIRDAVISSLGTRGRAGAPYGDGHAADAIALALHGHLA